MTKNKKPIVTPKRILLFVIKLILWLVPVLFISVLLEVILTGGYSDHFIGDMIVSFTAVFLLFSPLIIGSLKNTFYKTNKPKRIQKPTPKPVLQPQVVTNNNTNSNNSGKILYWILVIVGTIVVFSVIKGFLDWWFGLFGLGIGLILLIILF